MVDYVGAIKKPFGNMKTFGIGTLLGVIPLVNMIFIGGYALLASKNVLEGNKALPDWSFNKVVEYFLLWLKACIAAFVYTIPAMILMFLGFGTGLLSLLTGDVTAFFAAMTTGGIIILLGVLLFVLAVLVLPMGLMNMLKENRFTAVFAFGKAFKKMLTIKYFATLLVLIVYGIVLGIVTGILSTILMFIPIIGWVAFFLLYGAVIFASLTTTYSLFAEVYNETG
jgi:hypothetical protein